MNLSQNDTRALVITAPYCYQVNDFSMYYMRFSEKMVRPTPADETGVSGFWPWKNGDGEKKIGKIEYE